MCGVYTRVDFPKHSAISVELEDGHSLSVGDVVGLRTALRYREEAVSSLQREGDPVTTATGPCKVGIATVLTKSDLKTGQSVFARTS